MEKIKAGIKKYFKNMSMTQRILFCVIVPIITIGCIMILLTATLIRQTELNQVKSGLCGYAYMAEEAVRPYMEDLEAGKGDAVNATLDSLKLSTGMDITVFYGTDIVATSAKTSGNYRITSTELSETQMAEAMNDKGKYIKNLSVGDVKSMAFLIPLKIDSDKAVGIVMASQPSKKALSGVYTIMITFAGVILVILVTCMICTIFIIRPLIDALNQCIKGVQGMSDGKLDIVIRTPVLERGDEVGKLGASIETLKTSLKTMLGSIADSARAVNYASLDLNRTAEEMHGRVSGVQDAVSNITTGANTQADDTKTALESMIYMGDLITSTRDSAKNLNQGADIMKKLGDEATESIDELGSFNIEVKRAIDMITAQTTKTSESAALITDATKIISDIASETELLSLNASIEAARAGESGRGFAVVATQIQKLSEQSNTASASIEKVVEELAEDATKMVEEMKRFQEVMKKQNRHVDTTSRTFNELAVHINSSIENIKGIEGMSADLEESRRKIQDVITTLSGIATDNVTYANETNESITDVAGRFRRIQKASGRLKNTADELTKNTKMFEV